MVRLKLSECLHRDSDSRRVSFLHNLITMGQLTVVDSFRPVNLDDCRFALRSLAGAVLRRESFIKARITLRAILNEPYYGGREPPIHGYSIRYFPNKYASIANVENSGARANENIERRRIQSRLFITFYPAGHEYLIFAENY